MHVVTSLVANRAIILHVDGDPCCADDASTRLGVVQIFRRFGLDVIHRYSILVQLVVGVTRSGSHPAMSRRAGSIVVPWFIRLGLCQPEGFFDLVKDAGVLEDLGNARYAGDEEPARHLSRGPEKQRPDGVRAVGRMTIRNRCGQSESSRNACTVISPTLI